MFAIGCSRRTISTAVDDDTADLAPQATTSELNANSNVMNNHGSDPFDITKAAPLDPLTHDQFLRTLDLCLSDVFVNIELKDLRDSFRFPLDKIILCDFPKTQTIGFSEWPYNFVDWPKRRSPIIAGRTFERRQLGEVKLPKALGIAIERVTNRRNEANSFLIRFLLFDVSNTSSGDIHGSVVSYDIERMDNGSITARYSGTSGYIYARNNSEFGIEIE
jgi:hypothetical protein